MPIVTNKGQVTIPKGIRDALGLVPGSKVEFALEEGRVVLRKRVPVEAFERWRGYLKDRLPGDSVDETMELLRGEPMRHEDSC